MTDASTTRWPPAGQRAGGLGPASARRAGRGRDAGGCSTDGLERRRRRVSGRRFSTCGSTRWLYAYAMARKARCALRATRTARATACGCSSGSRRAFRLTLATARRSTRPTSTATRGALRDAATGPDGDRRRVVACSTAVWRRAMCTRHGLDVARASRFADGTLVRGLGGRQGDAVLGRVADGSSIGAARGLRAKRGDGCGTARMCRTLRTMFGWGAVARLRGRGAIRRYQRFDVERTGSRSARVQRAA